MPHYYFDLLNNGIEKDREGAELENDAAAQQEAKLRAMNGFTFRLQKYTGAKSIRVRNEKGDVVLEVKIRR
jgi:hypothetical protein